MKNPNSIRRRANTRADQGTTIRTDTNVGTGGGGGGGGSTVVLLGHEGRGA